jgi:bifunctional non-homologous end joining protein LigD
MTLTLVRQPFDRPGWVYEEKVDGWRTLAYKDGSRVRIVSRNGVDHTRRSPDLALAIAKLSARTLVLDGEEAIYDERLGSRFEWLREPDPAAVATPPLLMAFDLLYRNGRDLTARPLRQRRWRTSSPARSSSCPGAASRPTAWRRGSRCSSAATRGSWRRTRRARMKAARRGDGSR